MSNVTNKDFYVLKFMRANPSLINDQNALIAEIWESEDFWRHTDLLTALRSVTSADSIKRSHRALRENGWIEVDKQLLKNNMRQMEKVRDERGSSNIDAIKKNTEKPYLIEKARQTMSPATAEAMVAQILTKPVQTSLIGDNNV